MNKDQFVCDNNVDFQKEYNSLHKFTVTYMRENPLNLYTLIVIVFTFNMYLIFKDKESYIPTLTDYELRIENIDQRIRTHVGEVY